MLTCVIGRVGCFRCVCAPSRLKDQVLCVLEYIHVYLCSCFMLCVVLLVSFMQL